MDCRCYTGGKGRTRLNVLKYRFRDIFAFLLIGGLCYGIIYLNTLAPSLVR